MDDFEPPPQGAIFVFGSNLRGAHSKGTALTARRFYGALQGRGEGLINGCYALPTKDEQIRTLPFPDIEWRAIRFLQVAHDRPNLTFFVTRVGCGLAGYHATRSRHSSPRLTGTVAELTQAGL